MTDGSAEPSFIRFALSRYGIVVTVVMLVSLLLFSVAAPAFAPPAVNIGPLDQTYNLTIEDKTYRLRYGFSEGSSGAVDSMVANVTSKSITIIVSDYSTDSISDWKKRVFSVELPRTVINANATGAGQGCSMSENGYVVWSIENDIEYSTDVFTVNGVDAPAEFSPHFAMEGCARDTRTVSVEYPTGKSMIVIQGTVMIPEFPYPVVILVSAVIGAVIAISRTRLLSRLYGRGN